MTRIALARASGRLEVVVDFADLPSRGLVGDRIGDRVRGSVVLEQNAGVSVGPRHDRRSGLGGATEPASVSHVRNSASALVRTARLTEARVPQPLDGERPRALVIAAARAAGDAGIREVRVEDLADRLVARDVERWFGQPERVLPRQRGPPDRPAVDAGQEKRLRDQPVLPEPDARAATCSSAPGRGVSADR